MNKDITNPISLFKICFILVDNKDVVLNEKKDITKNNTIISNKVEL